jgi:hypothetical protein
MALGYGCLRLVFTRPHVAAEAASLALLVTGAYLIAAFRYQKIDGRATLGGSFAPLLNLAAVLWTSLLPAAGVFLVIPGLG